MEVLQMIMTIIETGISLIAAILVVLKIVQAAIKGASEEEVIRLLKVYCEQAEIDWGAGSGDKKFSEAVQKFYDTLPGIISIAYSLKDIQELVSQIIDQYNIQTPEGMQFVGIGQAPVEAESEES